MVKIKSLETLLFVTFSTCTILISMAFFVVAFLYSQSLTIAVYVLGISALSCGYLAQRIYKSVLKSYWTLGIQLDAIKEDNFLINSHSVFEEGVVANVHQQINAVSQQMLHKKSRYDNNVYFVYQLIAQLKTPVIIFNEHEQLIYSNKAANSVFNQNWEILKFTSAVSLGLVKVNKWQFADPTHNEQWQVLSSKFVENEVDRELVIFIDIELALVEEQVATWQKVVQVMGHEIRNTLAPISSLAQSLSSKQDNQRDLEALLSISTHCERLNCFINNYTVKNEDIEVHLRYLDLVPFINNFKKLYPKLKFNVEIQCSKLCADPVLLEQVFINLLTNAIEAKANEVWISAAVQSNWATITMLDNGRGMLNTDQAFTPLYTTKKSGKGIGLTFCKNVISRHQGKITLECTDIGTLVTISLPIKSSPV